MDEIAKTAEFHTLIDCIQHYHDQKSKAVSSISENNDINSTSAINNDEMGSSHSMEENTEQQSMTEVESRTVLEHSTDLVENNCNSIDARICDLIKPLLEELHDEVLKNWTTFAGTSSEVVEKLSAIRRQLKSDDITLNPRSVIQAQLQYVQLMNSHHLDNQFFTLREFVNVRSILKSDGMEMEMAADKLREASHKDHMKGISQEPFFQSLLYDMDAIVIEDKKCAMTSTNSCSRFNQSMR